MCDIFQNEVLSIINSFVVEKTVNENEQSGITQIFDCKNQKKRSILFKVFDDSRKCRLGNL